MKPKELRENGDDESDVQEKYKYKGMMKEYLEGISIHHLNSSRKT